MRFISAQILSLIIGCKVSISGQIPYSKCPLFLEGFRKLTRGKGEKMRERERKEWKWEEEKERKKRKTFIILEKLTISLLASKEIQGLPWWLR